MCEKRINAFYLFQRFSCSSLNGHFIFISKSKCIIFAVYYFFPFEDSLYQESEICHFVHTYELSQNFTFELPPIKNLINPRIEDADYQVKFEIKKNRLSLARISDGLYLFCLMVQKIRFPCCADPVNCGFLIFNSCCDSSRHLF